MEIIKQKIDRVEIAFQPKPKRCSASLCASIDATLIFVRRILENGPEAKTLEKAIKKKMAIAG